MENGNCRERHDGFLYLLPRLSTEPKPTPATHSNLASLPALVNACSAISRSLRDARDPSSSVELASPPRRSTSDISLQTILNVCSHFFQRMPRPEDIVALEGLMPDLTFTKDAASSEALPPTTFTTSNSRAQSSVNGVERGGQITIRKEPSSIAPFITRPSEATVGSFALSLDVGRA